MLPGQVGFLQTAHATRYGKQSALHDDYKSSQTPSSGNCRARPPIQAANVPSLAKEMDRGRRLTVDMARAAPCQPARR